MDSSLTNIIMSSSAASFLGVSFGLQRDILFGKANLTVTDKYPAETTFTKTDGTTVTLNISGELIETSYTTGTTLIKNNIQSIVDNSYKNRIHIKRKIIQKIFFQQIQRVIFVPS